MENNCARCGRKVRPDANWVRVHLCGSNAVFEWGCFIALLKAHGPGGWARRRPRAAGVSGSQG
jgi:hypothetical protein